MNELIKKASLGILLTAVFYTLICAGINRVYLSGKRAACWINPQYQRTGGQEWRIMNDWREDEKYSVVVYGSSHAYRGYDPAVFEADSLTMFTAGSGFQNTLASYVLMKYSLPPAEGSIVIIDLFDQTFEGDGVGCFTRLLQNIQPRQAATQLVWRSPDLRTFNSYMCRLMSDLNRTEIPDEPGYLRNGYCPKTDTMQADISNAPLRKTDFNPLFREYLRRCITEVRGRGCTPVLVSHPQPKNKANEEFHKAFEEFIAPVMETEKVLYLNYNTNHPLSNNEHFADANHLNQAGVYLFNQWLIEDLKKNGMINR